MSKPINGISPGEWAKHLRPWGKRLFWKQHRRALKVTELSDEDIALLATMKVKPRKKIKRYGIKLTYPPLRWLGENNEFSWTRWYKTRAAREAAYRSRNNGGGNSEIKRERIER